MERNLTQEIDEIKKDIAQIKELLESNVVSHPIKSILTHRPKAEQPAAFQNEEIKKLLINVEATVEERKDTGAVSYLGTFASSGRQSIWADHTVSTDTLLKLNENHDVEKVLSSIGNNQRMSILLALLKKPMTVTQLVDELNLNTTGQVYHHLKSLINADIVFEDETAERGTYMVKPHRVQGVIMILIGVKDLLDTKYTTGTWDEPNN